MGTCGDRILYPKAIFIHLLNLTKIVYLDIFILSVSPGAILLYFVMVNIVGTFAFRHTWTVPTIYTLFYISILYETSTRG